VSIKNDGHYFCRAGGNRPDGLNEPVTTIQENMLKGGISGRSAKGKRIHTRAIHNIDTDIKLNRALWVMAETLLESLR
nr:hypothetical protein [Escherichia coli]